MSEKTYPKSEWRRKDLLFPAKLAEICQKPELADKLVSLSMVDEMKTQAIGKDYYIHLDRFFDCAPHLEVKDPEYDMTEYGYENPKFP